MRNMAMDLKAIAEEVLAEAQHMEADQQRFSERKVSRRPRETAKTSRKSRPAHITNAVPSVP